MLQQQLHYKSLSRNLSCPSRCCFHRFQRRRFVYIYACIAVFLCCCRFSVNKDLHNTTHRARANSSLFTQPRPFVHPTFRPSDSPRTYQLQRTEAGSHTEGGRLRRVFGGRLKVEVVVLLRTHVSANAGSVLCRHLLWEGRISHLPPQTKLTFFPQTAAKCVLYTFFRPGQ